MRRVVASGGRKAAMSWPWALILLLLLQMLPAIEGRRNTQQLKATGQQLPAGGGRAGRPPAEGAPAVRDVACTYEAF
eukprot:scaffold1142_cov387-Prasinococcus_capsulatus_cf.AAC.20